MKLQELYELLRRFEQASPEAKQRVARYLREMEEDRVGQQARDEQAAKFA